MLLITNKILLHVIACIFILSLADKPVKAADIYNLPDTTGISNAGELQGYNDIVIFKSRFFAVGTDGRIDCITKSGEKKLIDNSCNVKLNCAFSNDEILIAAGNQGTILYSFDGEIFYHAESVTDKNIYAVTSKNGLILAGADRGVILASKNGTLWNIVPVDIKGNILSLSANNSFFIGVTNAGEIIKSFDGIKWEIKDYNKEYAGYNRFSIFKKILAAQNSIIIIGVYDDDSPSILFSSLGNVWTERLPVYQDDKGVDCCLTNKPNDIAYDCDRDQFILACDNGGVFSLPACTKCNEYTKISDNDLTAILYADSCLFIAGTMYSVSIQNRIIQE
jgi:hypothetical protein